VSLAGGRSVACGWVWGLVLAHMGVQHDPREPQLSYETRHPSTTNHPLPRARLAELLQSGRGDDAEAGSHLGGLVAGGGRKKTASPSVSCSQLLLLR
jgi:hypothetical protein